MVFDRQPVFARSLIPGGILFMENEGFEFDGIRFHSVSARPYLKGPVSLPANIDFLITHGPAYSYLDRDMGDKNLFLAIAGARPKFHIFGHVHEEGQKRKAMLGGTTFLNVAYFNQLRSSL